MNPLDINFRWEWIKWTSTEWIEGWALAGQCGCSGNEWTAWTYRDEVGNEDGTEHVGRHAAQRVDDENAKPAKHLLKATHDHQLNDQREQHVQDPARSTRTRTVHAPDCSTKYYGTKYYTRPVATFRHEEALVV